MVHKLQSIQPKQNQKQISEHQSNNRIFDFEQFFPLPCQEIFIQIQQ